MRRHLLSIISPWFVSLAASTAFLACAAPARAQLVCSQTAAVAPTLRHEGFTELVGNIELSCIGTPGAMPTPAGVPIPQVDISVSLNAPVTSRILGGAAPQLLTEALLLVDDPAPANQDPCLSPTDPAVACQVLGDGGQTFNQPNKFNIFEGLGGGSAPSPNSLTFLGVPADPPAAGVRTYRITNVRIDATSVSLSGGLSPAIAFVSASPAFSLQIANTQAYVGFVANGLAASTTSGNQIFLQCLNYPVTQVGTVTFAEDFATAFKVKTNGVQNSPTTIYYSESGLEVSLGGLAAGKADTGTRLQTLISNIPPGVSIYVDNWAQSTASLCPEVCSDATLATGPATPSDPGVNTITQVSSGGQTSVLMEWEVTNTNSVAIDQITFHIYVSSTGVAAANVTATAISGFGPQLAAYASSGPIPEFSSTVNVPPTPTTLFTIAGCPTISGHVTLGGNGLAGVSMALTGSETGSSTTDSSGKYSFGVPSGGSYTVTPSLAGYSFAPPSQTFASVSTNQVANFTATAVTTPLLTLISFPGGNGGAFPYAGVVIGGGGVLYGTTAADGASNHGTVYALSPPTAPGGDWTEKVLTSFSGGANGSDPQTAVTISKSGVIYGSASTAIFSLTPPGAPGGMWTEQLLHNITGSSSLVISPNGALYGTTISGGSASLGTVYALTPPTPPGGTWTETVLHNFTGPDGSHPYANVVIGTGGVLYGTTNIGGATGYGAVFSLTPPTSPGGPWTEAVLYSFTGGAGANPKAGVTIGAGGVVYGATYFGGSADLGEVFGLSPPKTQGGAWTKHILHSFTGGTDGAYPVAGVVADSAGNLYGTTAQGGGSSFCVSQGVTGCGTVWALTPPKSPGGAWTETLLYSFTGAADGGDPRSSLVLSPGGLLYGTSAMGGAANNGTVFAIRP